MVNKGNYEEYMLLYADGELNEQESQALLHFVAQHPELKAELDAYMSTILTPNNTMLYPDKTSLMKPAQGGRTIFFGGWRTYATAASVALLIAMFLLTKKDNLNSNATTIAKHNQPITQPENVQTNKRATQRSPKALAQSAPINTITPKTNTVHQQTKKTPIHAQPTTNKRLKRYQTTVKALETAPIRQLSGNISPEIVAVTIDNGLTNNQPTAVAKAAPKRKTTDYLPILNDNKALVNGIENVLTQKINMAKHTVSNLIGADVVLKLGNKEILIVKL